MPNKSWSALIAVQPFDACHFIFTALQPSNSSCTGIFRILVFSRIFNAFIKNHCVVEPRLAWISCFLPDHKNTVTVKMRVEGNPSSVILRDFERLNTWNPPLSVKIGPFQQVVVCETAELYKYFYLDPASTEMIGVAKHYLAVIAPPNQRRKDLHLMAAVVATFIKAGVWTVPCTVTNSPRRAVFSFFIKRYMKRLLLLYNKHRIAKWEETVFLLYGHAISVHGVFITAKGRNKHNQRTFRQMKICD